MKALIFCGYHNTGKTSLIEKAVKTLTMRGYSVITVKHTPKDHAYTLHTAAGDTGRLLEAGSRIAVQVTDSTIVQYRDVQPTRRSERSRTKDVHQQKISPPSPLIQEPQKQNATSLLNTLFSELNGDFVLIEGFKSYEGLPRIVFGHTRRDILQLATNSTVAFSGWEIETENILALETGLKIGYISPSAEADVMADFIERHAREIGK